MATRIEEFVAKYKDDALRASADTGLPASLILAQSALESGYGASSLARVYNNMFGIKDSSSWTGKIVDLPTKEEYGGKMHSVTASFRSYDSAADSFRDWGKFLQDNPRYTKAGVFSATTAYQAADALQLAGYATDSKYAAKLKGIIRAVEESPNFKQTTATPEAPPATTGFNLKDWLSKIGKGAAAGVEKIGKSPAEGAGKIGAGVGGVVGEGAYEIGKGVAEPAKEILDETKTHFIVVGVIAAIIIVIILLVFMTIRSSAFSTVAQAVKP
jgi:hypothetical protein